jgi:hypothetical protein
VNRFKALYTQSDDSHVRYVPSREQTRTPVNSFGSSEPKPVPKNLRLAEITNDFTAEGGVSHMPRRSCTTNHLSFPKKDIESQHRCAAEGSHRKPCETKGMFCPRAGRRPLMGERHSQPN